MPFLLPFFSSTEFFSAIQHPRPVLQTFEWQTFGTSVSGLPLKALVVGEGSQAVLVMGAIHGDEPASGRIVKILIDECLATAELPPDTRFIFIPTANPDGLLAGTRVNRNKVDVNRNFNAQWAPQARAQRYSPGPSPESEPETRALDKFIREQKPRRMMSIHYPLYCVNWDGPGAEAWANKMAAFNGYPVKGDIGYPTPGSLGKFCIDLGVPLITLELPKSDVPRMWEDNRDALRIFLGLEPIGKPKQAATTPL